MAGVARVGGAGAEALHRGPESLSLKFSVAGHDALEEAREEGVKASISLPKHLFSRVCQEFGRDPVLLVALHMWEREVTGLRTSNAPRHAYDMTLWPLSEAFREWKRKMNQIKKARGAAGTLGLQDSQRHSHSVLYVFNMYI